MTDEAALIHAFGPITCDKIRALGPCYDPAEKLPENYEGSVVDFLRQENVPTRDRIWVAKHFLSDRTNRLFAVWCARQALALQTSVDPRSIVACDVAERFIKGEATEAELAAAHSAARSAADSADSAASAADSAADLAAYLAARSAASAAYSAARSAASAAYSAASAADWAARSAADSAARSAADLAVHSAASAARSAASAADSAQINYLIELIEREEP
jgi:hypothetical protein